MDLDQRSNADDGSHDGEDSGWPTWTGDGLLRNRGTSRGLHPQSETAKMGTLSQRMGGDCLYAESDLWRGLQNGCGGTDTQGRKLLGGGARAGSEAQAAVRMEGALAGGETIPRPWPAPTPPAHSSRSQSRGRCQATTTDAATHCRTRTAARQAGRHARFFRTSLAAGRRSAPEARWRERIFSLIRERHGASGQGALSIVEMCRLAELSRASFYRYWGEHAPREHDTELRDRI